MNHGQSRFKVNCLIVGTQKGGTTALAHFLSMHSDVCVADRKEAHFFDSDKYDESTDPGHIARQYQNHFSAYSGETICCDATPIYMYLPWVARRIHAYNPAMKLIFLLRNPGARAISQYHMEFGRGTEKLSLWRALLAEPFRLGDKNLDRLLELRYHSYLHRGFYTNQILGLLKYFPREQMLFIRSDRLQYRHDEVLHQIYKFLGLQSPAYIPDQEQVFKGEYNPGDSLMIRWLLSLYFKRETRRLENLLSWDLTDWRTV